MTENEVMEFVKNVVEMAMVDKYAGMAEVDTPSVYTCHPTDDSVTYTVSITVTPKQGVRKASDCCNGCPYHYELTEEQEQNYDGHCGCESIEKYGSCWKATQEEYEDR